MKQAFSIIPIMGRFGVNSMGKQYPAVGSYNLNHKCLFFTNQIHIMNYSKTNLWDTDNLQYGMVTKRYNSGNNNEGGSKERESEKFFKWQMTAGEIISPLCFTVVAGGTFSWWEKKKMNEKEDHEKNSLQ